MKLIKTFQNISKNDVKIAGGKGASLGEMTQSKIPVPPGFVILSNAFDKFLEANNLETDIDAILHNVDHTKIHTVENASEKIRALILSAEIPEKIANEILRFFKELKADFVAIRSSATAEDSSFAAWAGQLESYLNTTKKDLLENVKKCWASLFLPRAIIYRFEKNLHKHPISVAVVVQKMIQSEVAGISFSVHPITQDKKQMLIEAGIGLGESVVSGQITPDSYVIEKTNWKIIDKNIAKQTKVLKKSGGKNVWKTIASDKQKLTDSQIIELAKLTVRIGKHYNFPVDIEWALENGNFHIVQSRPITTISETTIVRNELDFVLSKDWIFLVGRPYTLFGASLYQRWFDPPQILELFGESILDNLYIEEHPSVVRRYVTKDQLEVFKKTIEKIVKNDKKKCEEILKRGLALSDKAKEYLNKNPFSDLKSAVDFLVELTLHATVFSYFSYPILTEIKNEKLLPIAEKLRGISYYPDIVQKIINPLAKKEAGENFNFLTVTEILSKDLTQAKTRKKESQTRRFVYAKINNKEHILYVDDVFELIRKLDHIQVGDSVRGQTAYPGKVVGTAKLILSSTDLNVDFKDGDILVAVTTNPTLMPLIRRSSAIVSDEGGVTCHAAIVSRELKKPCIIGTKFATHIFQNEDIIEVDATNGVVRLVERKKQ
jgi:phosphoenolpyruvate synthase/pyruvate phosphate dikinase